MTANHKWDVQQAGKILNTSRNPTILFVGFFFFPFYIEEFPVSILSVGIKQKRWESKTKLNMKTRSNRLCRGVDGASSIPCENARAIGHCSSLRSCPPTLMCMAWFGWPNKRRSRKIKYLLDAFSNNLRHSPRHLGVFTVRFGLV